MNKYCRISGIFFILALVTQACQEKEIQNFQPTVQSRVRFDLSSLQPDHFAKTRGTTVSVFDSLALMINEAGGAMQAKGQKLLRGDSLVTIDVEVPRGETVFSAYVLSNTGVVLYAGDQTVHIEENGFNVEIILAPQREILMVSPDSLTISWNSPDTFWVHNEGADSTTLSWWIEAIEPDLSSCHGNACLEFSSFGGFVPGQEYGILTTYVADTTVSVFRARIASGVGYVDVQIRVLP